MPGSLLLAAQGVRRPDWLRARFQVNGYLFLCGLVGAADPIRLGRQYGQAGQQGQWRFQDVHGWLSGS
jgi:hypothetical protein